MLRKAIFSVVRKCHDLYSLYHIDHSHVGRYLSPSVISAELLLPQNHDGTQLRTPSYLRLHSSVSRLTPLQDLQVPTRASAKWRSFKRYHHNI
jgi:hypothetical protein